ncbi:hypothetical protein ACFLRZ_00505 [Bacteroidota bacterium]
MENLKEIQSNLFNQIKERLPTKLSFVHEIAELLGISYDSAYRRIRLDKELSLDEVYKLSTHFNISVDSLFNIQNNKVDFYCHSLEPAEFNVEKWLGMIYVDIKRIFEAKEKKIIYAAKDPPMFHYFHFPEIAAFKTFFWQKTLFQFPEFNDKPFRLDDSSSNLISTGQQILSLSTKIPTIEIWNEDTFNMLLRQIEFYWISGYFEKKNDVLILCEKTEQWIRHTQKQAELGFKFLYGKDPEGIEDSFKLYENEVVLNDNTIFARVENVTTTYLTFNVLGLLITTDPMFCGYIENHMKGLLKKSILISQTNEKERNRFFNRLLQTVNQFKSRIN